MLNVATLSIQKVGVLTSAIPTSSPTGVESKTETTVLTQKSASVVHPMKRCMFSNALWLGLRNTGKAEARIPQHSAERSHETTRLAKEYPDGR